MATTKITSPDLFDLGSLNTALQLPNGTTAERPTSPSTGEWRYNTTTNLIEFWDGGEWRELKSEAIPPTPSEHFSTVLYSGNSSTQAITGVGFQPDWVWIKERGPAAENHNLTDSSRGTNKIINSNNTNAEVTSTNRITSFDSDGFTLGSNNETNDSGSTYVAWCWKANGGTTTSNGDGSRSSTVQANTQGGFSIVEWTGDGSTATIGHGLNAAPELIIVKTKTAVSDWPVYCSGLTSAAYRLVLNSTDGENTTNDEWNSTDPTSTVFSVGSGGNVSGSGQDFVGYCFHSVAGYSKIGSYTGNGTGQSIVTGFEVDYVLIKGISFTTDWMLYDQKRGNTQYLIANVDSAEGSSGSPLVEFYTNGFGVTTSNSENKNGETFIYAAFAKDASSAPTLANSFNTSIYNGSGTTRSIGGVGFSPNLVWVKCRDAVGQNSWFDTIRGPLNRLDTAAQSSQSNVANTLISFDSDGFTFGNEAGNNNGETNVAWMWKASTLPAINTDGTDTSIVSANVAAGFSIAALPDKAGTQNLGHGLDGVPDLIIMKQYEGGTGGWLTYNSVIGVRNYMTLNTTAGNTAATPGYEYDAVTATTITNLVSGSTYSYIYYCWKSVAGFSKVGSYSGNSSTQSITGLGFQPDWVMIKRYDGTENWYIQDSRRGSTMQLYANLNDAEFNESNAVTSFDSDGWTMGSYNGINNTGEDYIYIAFKDNPAQPAVASGEMEYLVVAGGGGSSSDSGGGAGAGAGGLRTSYGSTSGGGASAETAITLAAGTYTITVGGGGTGTNGGGSTTSTDGVASTISGNATVNTVGGGSGGDAYQSGTLYEGQVGGSGGGAGNGNGSVNPPGGAGTANEGFAGGAGNTAAGAGNDGLSGGGGGGAAEVGSDGANGVGGNGANGLMVAIDGTSAVYAGGGGGGCRGTSGTKVGAGGQGGGGYGTSSGAGNAGSTNTGGGAGGGRSDGAAGGSGVVILRMNTSDYSGSVTGSPTVTTSGSETILTYTGSGTYVHS